MGGCACSNTGCDAAAVNDMLNATAAPLDGPETPLAAKLRPCDGGALCTCQFGPVGKCSSAIIFLDVDGVLHATGAPFSSLFGHLHMRELRRIVEASQARIVLSTAWRLSQTFAGRVINELAEAGLPPPISATPSLCPWHSDGRALEIRAWLLAHTGLVEDDRWVAIDDIPLAPVLPIEHVVTTNGKLGLTPELANSAIAKLNGGGSYESSPIGSIAET
uniref:FCP1 homology domain-containing protein n=1 Tax=Alexandrium catenella TaxID=2925 RepID=A0A7S1WML9_ALECA|mmetsp:Transcript_74660/g.198369  ORF Transcript_74660/g.198369 Transcript_74660/m.198369 type:complete len:219 (+) Transcript_74660:62-718(+)